MASVFHRTNKTFLRFANTPEYNPVDWIINPVFPAGVPDTIPYKYLNTQAHPDNTITEMTQPEKDAVDAAALSVQRDSTAADLDELEGVLRAFVLALLDERNRMAAAFNDLKNGIAAANNLNDAKTAAAAISDEPIRTVGDIKTGVRNKLGS